MVLEVVEEGSGDAMHSPHRMGIMKEVRIKYVMAGRRHSEGVCALCIDACFV